MNFFRTVKGKKLPPPPRKVIIERLPEFPPKPQPVIIERWLPYPPVKRKVIYQRLADEREEVQIKPRNVIIQWESPNVTIRQELKNLGSRIVFMSGVFVIYLKLNLNLFCLFY